MVVVSNRCAVVEFRLKNLMLNTWSFLLEWLLRPISALGFYYGVVLNDIALFQKPQ